MGSTPFILQVAISEAMRAGEVFEIPKKQWSKSGSVYEFKNIPVYDSPILIAEKSMLHLKQ